MTHAPSNFAPRDAHAASWLPAGGGEMGERVRAFDWAATPLGPAEGWPIALRAAVEICLGSHVPVFVWWGPELVGIYNDACAAVLGRRHADGLGRAGREIFAGLGPLAGYDVDTVLRRGQAVSRQGVRLVVERDGRREEATFTYSASPIPDGAGGAGGVFQVWSGETAREPAERAREGADARREERVRARATELAEIGAALEESEARFRLIADTLPHMVWATLPDGAHYYYNRRWYEFTGVPEGSTDGEGWNGMFHPDDQGRAWARWRHSLATGEPYEIEYRLRHRSGEYRWTLGRALPVRNERGEIERWLGTCTDIDAMKRLTAEREELLERERTARADAEAASRAKDKFLAVLSHELRTPLSPVVMAVPAMAADPDMPEKFREDLEMVRRNIDLEVKLIDDLLDLSRVTSGKLRLHVREVGLHEVLRHAVQSSVSEAPGPRPAVLLELDAADDRLAADPARLQQVFWNLVRNALKFTPAGGTVTVRTSNPAEGRVRVEVIDTGAGIAANVLPRVFDAFEQGDLRTTHQFGGLGLGLAIARAVVEMHGGTIAADSAGPGRGATFTVELATAAAAPIPVTETARPASPAAAGGDASAAPPRVLLVEDHADTARLLARLLHRAGYAVTTADSAGAALRIAAATTFDVVVSDIGLPDATGYELMTRLRARHGMRGIALSGYGMEEDMRQSKAAGFIDHVVKPVDVAHLEAVLRRVIGTR